MRRRSGRSDHDLTTKARAADNKKFDTAAKLCGKPKGAAVPNGPAHDVLRRVGMSIPSLGLHDPEI